jgi:hypothetical protein
MESDFKDLSRVIARMLAERWVEDARRQQKCQPRELPAAPVKHEALKNRKPSSKKDRRTL